MPTVNSSPFGPKPQFEIAAGTPAIGNQLFFYVAGSVNTKRNTYTDSTGSTANTNPIVLNALGMPVNEIWFTEGESYKVVYAPAGDTDPPTSPIWTIDNLRGINDSSPTISYWAPNYLACDGVTDDRAAFDALVIAVNAAGGGIIYFPGCTVLLDSFSSSYYTVKPLSNVSIIGAGPQTIFKFGNGLRSPTQGLSFLYDHSAYFENCTYSNFCVDWNGANNLDTSGSLVEHTNRMGGAAGMKNVRYLELTHKNSAGAHFIYVSNATATSNACEDVHVRGCTFTNCGMAIAGNNIADHTSVYMDASQASVCNNHFIQPNLDDTVSAAFETHKGDVITEGNTVYGYHKMMNIGAQLGNASNVLCSNNIADQIGEFIDLYTSGAYVLESVKIIGNQCRLRQETGVNISGIRATTTNMASSANMSNISIAGNKISGPASGLDLALPGIAIQMHRCDDVKVYDNEIELFPGEAIWFAAETAAKKLRRIDVSENKIRSCGIGTTAASKRAMVFNSGATPGTDDIDYLWVNDNVIVCDAPVGTVASWGIDFNNGRFPNTWVEDNDITGASALPIRKTAATADNFFVRAKAALNPFGNIRASKGSEWFDLTNGRFNRATLGTNDTDCWMSESWAAAMPAAGTYQAGDKVWNTAPATPAASVAGWLRVTTGSNHVLNTDWVEMNSRTT